MDTPVKFDYSSLARLPKKTLPAMLECAGNNRSDLDPSVPGNPFQDGAVSNAIWEGALLKPFLQQAGLSPNAVCCSKQSMRAPCAGWKNGEVPAVLRFK